MDASLDHRVGLAEHLLRLRWVWMSLMGGLIVFRQLSERGSAALQNPDLELLVDILLLAVTIPLLGGFLLTRLERSHSLSSEYRRRLQKYQALVQELSQRRELGELTSFLVQYPAAILPIRRTSLYIYDHHLAHLELAGDSENPGAVPALPSSSPYRICRTCLGSDKLPMHQADPCPFVASSASHPVSDEFCLALSYGKVLIGTLRLTCRAGRTLTPEQIEFLNDAAPEMALALAFAIANPRQMAHVRLQTRLMEQQQTAIDLHNALAQQISFLHLGLDRLAGGNQLPSNAGLREDLEHLRLAAAEAYQQVRNTLALLLPRDSADLTQAIVDHFVKVARRAHLSHAFTTQGEPVVLPALMRRRIFGLVQEGLSNIEKYAQAQHVQVDLVWTADSLSLSIADNGKGFDPSALPGEGHYGLMMMGEIVKTMRGHFEISSSPGQGTTLEFRIPLPAVQQDSAEVPGGHLHPQALTDLPVPAE